MRQSFSTLADRFQGSDRFNRPIARAANAMLGQRGCLFTFHRAASSSAWPKLPNQNFYLELEFLDRLLSYLARAGWDVVTLDEALRRADRKNETGRFVNFSVDDCYRDTFEQVIPLFRRHKVPVTLFVTTGIPDGTLPMWCAGLEDTILNNNRIQLDDQTIDVGTAEAKRAAYNKIALAWEGSQENDCYARFCSQNRVDADAMHSKHAMSWDMLATLRHDPLVEVGAHTVMHTRISSLPPQAAQAELFGSRERLRAKLGVPVRHFAFPFGRSGDCGRRDFDIARQAGYASAATTRKGLVRSGQDPFTLPRNTLNGAHRNLALIELHLSGLTGIAARMLGRV